MGPPQFVAAIFMRRPNLTTTWNRYHAARPAAKDP